MFPAYRKYKNSKTFYKIINENSFEEISFVGEKAFLYQIEANQYPEYLRIQDMLACKDGIWEEIDVKNYETQKNSI